MVRVLESFFVLDNYASERRCFIVFRTISDIFPVDSPALDNPLHGTLFAQYAPETSQKIAFPAC